MLQAKSQHPNQFLIYAEDMDINKIVNVFKCVELISKIYKLRKN